MSKKDQAPAPEKTDSGVTYSDPIILEKPIKRVDKVIETVRLRKPRTGELRGLSFTDLATADVTAVIDLIPRISEPPLHPEEVEDLDPADSTEMAGAIRRFFMSKAQIAAAEAMMAG